MRNRSNTSTLEPGEETEESATDTAPEPRSIAIVGASEYRGQMGPTGTAPIYKIAAAPINRNPKTKEFEAFVYNGQTFRSRRVNSNGLLVEGDCIEIHYGVEKHVGWIYAVCPILDEENKDQYGRPTVSESELFIELNLNDPAVQPKPSVHADPDAETPENIVLKALAELIAAR